jgi:glycosyltransferase involved in cell wall biosynthesis
VMDEQTLPTTRPAISIITPSYNRAGMIAQAIESVLAQGFEAFEHIIVDGGSTDETPGILAHYPHLKVISSADEGMYDALNKGLEIAAGQSIGFLNTDDLYAKNIFPAVAREFENPEVMAVAGHAIVFSEGLRAERKILDSYDPGSVGLMESLAAGGAYFNAWFFRRSVFDRIGPFNATYKIAGDREFMLRFALQDLPYTAIPDLVYKYRMHPGSLTFDKTDEKRARSAEEHLEMTGVYLAGQSLPAHARSLLIRLRTRETVDMAARSLGRGKLRDFWRYVREGLKYDRTWPLSFGRYVLKRSVALMGNRAPFAE